MCAVTGPPLETDQVPCAQQSRHKYAHDRRFLQFAIAAVAAFHSTGGGSHQTVIQKGQGLAQQRETLYALPQASRGLISPWSGVQISPSALQKTARRRSLYLSEFPRRADNANLPSTLLPPHFDAGKVGEIPKSLKSGQVRIVLTDVLRVGVVVRKI